MKKIVTKVVIALLVTMSFGVNLSLATYDGGSQDNGYNAYTLTTDLNFQADLTEHGVKMSWTPYYTEGFNYYKIIRSVDNQDPVYPDHGYIKYSGDKEFSSFVDKNPKKGKINYYRICSIAKPARYCSKVVKIEVPNDFGISSYEKYKQEFEDFKDITKSDWVYDYAKKLKTHGIVNGTNNNLNPFQNLNRAEAVTMLVRAYEKLNGEIEDTSDHEFDDVSESHWAYKILQKALSEDIIADNDKFVPEGSITRGQFSKIVAMAIYKDEIDELSSIVEEFSDVPTDHWARQYIHVMKRKGIINGYGNGKFGPENILKRAEAMKILTIAMELINRDILKTYDEEI